MSNEGYSSAEGETEGRLEPRRRKRKSPDSPQVEELRYRQKIMSLIREIRAQVYTNAAMVDEVSRLNYAIWKAEEDNKIIIRQLRNYERNRIRRIKNHMNREDAAIQAAQAAAAVTPTPSPVPPATPAVIEEPNN